MQYKWHYSNTACPSLQVCLKRNVQMNHHLQYPVSADEVMSAHPKHMELTMRENHKL